MSSTQSSVYTAERDVTSISVPAHGGAVAACETGSPSQSVKGYSVRLHLRNPITPLFVSRILVDVPLVAMLDERPDEQFCASLHPIAALWAGRDLQST